MTPDDLAALHRAAFDQQRPWTAAEFSALLDSPFVFLCGDPHGFALGRVIAGEAELLTLATHPEQRRRGLGRKWLHAYENQARERDATDFFLEVARDNANAIALYRSAGYDHSATRSDYYRHPDGHSVDALIMTKTLQL